MGSLLLSHRRTSGAIASSRGRLLPATTACVGQLDTPDFLSTFRCWPMASAESFGFRVIADPNLVLRSPRRVAMPSWQRREINRFQFSTRYSLRCRKAPLSPRCSEWLDWSASAFGDSATPPAVERRRVSPGSGEPRRRAHPLNFETLSPHWMRCGGSAALRRAACRVAQIACCGLCPCFSPGRSL